MADRQPHKTRLKDRVRIKDEVTHMYPNARVYSEGVVRSRMHDSLGYPLIYIEWDKDHWAYSGEEDRWVLEAHFDKVEESQMADEKPDFMKALADLIARYQTSERELEEINVTELEDDYESVLSKAVEDARGGDAFIVFVAYPEEEHKGAQIIMPRIYTHSRRDDAALLLDATAADYVAHSYSRLITDHIQVRRDGQTGT